MSTAALIMEESALSLAEERYEVVYGHVYMMASPSTVHQRISFKLAAQLDAFFGDKPCTPYSAPYDVYILAEEGDTRTRVEPDLVVICDKDKLRPDGYYGPPTLIIEILSQDRAHDLVTKYNLYWRAGVEEYIVIDPDGKIAQVFERAGDGWKSEHWSFQDRVPSRRFEGLSLDLSFPLPF